MNTAMDAAEIGVLIGGAVLIGFVIWFFFGARKDEKPAPASKTRLYACPMHPWITSSDAAASCSICGMKLVQSSP